MNYLVSQYGAAGDGVTNDAAAIQAAIDACSTAGGGVVVLESGHTYYSSSLVLKPGVEFHLERGSVLRAHQDIDTYVHPNGGEKDLGVDRVGTPVTLKPSYAFLYARDADHICITGEGTIDGNGFSFVHRLNKHYCNGDFYPRPTLVYLENCDHISVTGIIMCNVPFWTLHVAGCEDVLISGMRILNPLDVANSDGIDVDHSRNVRIVGCHIVCADDCICLKTTAGNAEYGPTRNVVVTGCTLCSTSAALKIGTESVDDFENVIIDNCIIEASNRGISLQLRDGGSIRNVSFSNIMIETRRFSEEWWGCAEPIAVTAHDRDPQTPVGSISNVRFTNITCQGENGVFVSGNEREHIEDVVFDRVQVTLRATSKWPRGEYDLRPGAGKGIEKVASSGFRLCRADGVRLRDCRVRFAGEDLSDFGQALYAEDCVDLQLTDFDGQAARDGFEDIEIR